jgi:hypothetical protein
MKKKIEEAVEKLVSTAERATNPDEAMKYAQSVLNLVNALAVLDRIERDR